MPWTELIWLCYDFGIYTTEIVYSLDSIDLQTFGDASELFEDLCHDAYEEYGE